MSGLTDRKTLRLRVLEALSEKPEWAVRLLAVRLIVTASEQELDMEVARELTDTLEAEVLPELEREGWLAYEAGGTVRFDGDPERLERVLNDSVGTTDT